MKSEYDFSQAERGKFYHPDVQLNLPIYLDPEVADYLVTRANAKGVALNDMVNELLRKDIALIEMVQS
jgi:predicted HicB family RNase H-like nuclease